jgi:hypothetical protein
MPGLMDFLEPFTTGYLETKIAGQEKRAEFIQKQDELADANLAAIAKNRAIQLDNLQIENDNLETIRKNEEEQLLKQHGDMNPVVLKYLQDQNYFYDKATWTAFSEEFKKEAGGSDKWYQQEVVGSGGISWQDMMADQLNKSFNTDDAKNAVDLPTNTKNLVMDFSVKDQPFNLLNAKSLNPTAIIEYNQSLQNLEEGKIDFDIKTFTRDMNEATKEDTIELLKEDLRGATLTNNAKVITNRITSATELDEIALIKNAKQIQEQKLKMVTWDADNKNTIGNLSIDIQNQNKELNDLAIKSATYDLETQPSKDFVDNQLKQADLLSKNINNSSLRQKNTLIINQLKTNIKNVEQQMGIVEASKDLNLEKLKLNVKNLEIENAMDELMLDNQPQINVLKLQKIQLDIAAQEIENGTAGDIAKETLENIKKRNAKLEQNIGSFDEEQKLAFELQQKRIEKIEKELAEDSPVKMYDEPKLSKQIIDYANESIGVPSKGSSPVTGTIWAIDEMKIPWIKPTLNTVTAETNRVVKDYFTQIKEGTLVNKQVEQIDINNVTNRILAQNLSKQFSKSNTDGLNFVKTSYKNSTGKDLSDNQIAEITQAILELHLNENISDNTKLLTKYKIPKNTGIFTATSPTGEINNTTKNPWKSNMLNIINKFKGGSFKVEDDIR